MSAKEKQYRVLSVSQNLYVKGGSDRMFLATMELLEKNGNSVIPFTASDPMNMDSEWAEYFPKASNFEAPGLFDLKNFVYSTPAARAIRNLVEEHIVDIAHLHIYYGKLTSSILRPLKQSGVPIVQTLHEYKLICPVYTLLSNDEICEACRGKHFWQAALKRCNRRSVTRSILSAVETQVSHLLGAIDKIDHFIAVSDFVRLKMIENGVPESKITTIYNFVDCSFSPKSYNPGEYFLFVGRLEKTKGLSTLLEAASKVPSVPLLVVGTGSIENELANWVTDRGLKHIRFLGFRSGKELAELFSNSLCVILPSEWYEPFAITLLESFSHGKPVVGSNIGGIPEAIDHGSNGFLFEPSDTDALVENMKWVASHRQEAADMGRNGRLMLENRFSPEVHYRNLIKLYDKVT